MPYNEMPKPIRRTCIFINRYEKESIETIEDVDGSPDSSKIRFRRFLVLKAKSLLHEFEIMRKCDLQYVHDIVKHTSHFKKIKYFIEEFEIGKEAEKLHDAVWTGDFVAVKTLLDNGVSPNAPTPSSAKNLHCGSMAPITAAIYKGFEEIVQLLLEHGADLHPKYVDEFPLNAAASLGEIDMLKLLLSRGANINAQDYYGRTVIQASCYGGYEVYKFLMEQGADPTILDNDGSSALHSAIVERDGLILKDLIARGLDVNQRNRFNQTPKGLAIRFRNLEAIGIFNEFQDTIDGF